MAHLFTVTMGTPHTVTHGSWPDKNGFTGINVLGLGKKIPSSSRRPHLIGVEPKPPHQQNKKKRIKCLPKLQYNRAENTVKWKRWEKLNPPPPKKKGRNQAPYNRKIREKERVHMSGDLTEPEGGDNTYANNRKMTSRPKTIFGKHGKEKKEKNMGGGFQMSSAVPKCYSSPEEN